MDIWILHLLYTSIIYLYRSIHNKFFVINLVIITKYMLSAWMFRFEDIWSSTSYLPLTFSMSGCIIKKTDVLLNVNGDDFMYRNESFTVLKLYCPNCGSQLTIYPNQDQQGQITCPKCCWHIQIRKGRRYYEIKLHIPKT